MTSGKSDADLTELTRRHAQIKSEMPVLLPAELPADLERAWISDMDHRYAMTNFYSVNQPLVIVCSGGNQGCLDRMVVGRILRREKVNGEEVLVALPKAEHPSLPEEPLRTDLEEFWSNVPLVRDPQWLDGN